MLSLFFRQFLTIFIKNTKTHFRSYAFFKEMFNLGLAIGVVIIINHFGDNGLIPLVMSLSVMLFCRGVAFSWVEDRFEYHSKLQQVMGLSKVAYFVGWMTFYLLNCVVLSLIMIGCLNAAGALDDYSL